jgi:hypothetical protein
MKSVCAFDKGWETFAIISNLVGKGQKNPKKKRRMS